MPMPKYGAAHVLHPHVTRENWSNIRTAGKAARVGNELAGNLVDRASTIFGATFDPSTYLLTHATIVASVDVYKPPGIRMGAVVEDGFRVNRKFGDFRVKPACDKYINNNKDAWSRQVLLAAYPTFIGGHNFVEHVQMEELSKGRIVDAVARDIGDSVYVDILIATDRQHKDLVTAIENGKMGTLSMGCTVDGTICTKCGHWAADETEMCPHIKYGKGNTFYDEQGRMHRIAELCGHSSMDPSGGVTFIEASWVETPAFTGAVLRNVLEPTPEISLKAQQILASPPPQWSADAALRAASMALGTADATVVKTGLGHPQRSPLVAAPTLGSDFLSGWEDLDEGGDEDGGEAETPAAPDAPAEEGAFENVEKELERHLTDQVKKRVKKKLDDKDVDDALSPEDSSMDPNDSVIKEARSKVAMAYKVAVETLVRKSASDVELIDDIASLNARVGVQIPVSVYRTSLKVGRSSRYDSLRTFLAACQRALGKVPTESEARTLIRLGKILSRFEER